MDFFFLSTSNKFDLICWNSAHWKLIVLYILLMVWLFPQVILLNIFMEREETQGTHSILRLILKVLSRYHLLLFSR